jgi:hypothetical protein
MITSCVLPYYVASSEGTRLDSQRYRRMVEAELAAERAAAGVAANEETAAEMVWPL